MFHDQRSEDIELPHFNSDDIAQRQKNTENYEVDEEERERKKNNITIISGGSIIFRGNNFFN